MSNETPMLKMLRTAIEGLVPDASQLKITERVLDGLYHYSVELPKPYRGFVLGKSGHTWKALQSIVSAISRRCGSRVFLELLEND